MNFKKNCFKILCQLIFPLLTIVHVNAQDDLDLSLKFKKDKDLSTELKGHYFSPVKRGIAAYDRFGKPKPTFPADTYIISYVMEGTYHGISGKWIVEDLHYYNSTFIPYNSLVKDVTGKKNVSIAVTSISDLFRRITHSDSFILLLFLLPFVIVGTYVYRIAPERIGLFK